MASENWLIVGLGNPGSEYEFTRHNVGFMLIDRFAQRLNIRIKRLECRALVGQSILGNNRIELVKPQTYMNLSGESINCLLHKENRSVAKFVAIVDDLSLPIGAMRFRGKGSAGGHNGLKSIIRNVKTLEFIRLRVGIKPSHEIQNASKFVLDRFTRSEMAEIEKTIEEAIDGIELLIGDGIEKAMSSYN